MKAIVLATGVEPALAPLTDHQPGVMLPLLDRPFLQHTIELLASQGVNDVHLVLHHLPEQIENWVGTGTRWGIRIGCHLARDPEAPFAVVRTLALGREPILLVRGSRLPAVRLAEARPQADGAGAVLYMAPPAGSKGEGLEAEWTGWAWIAPRLLAEIPPILGRNELESWLVKHAPDNIGRVMLSMQLCMESYQGVLDANRALLDKTFSGLLQSGREVEPGVWISRNVRLHPSAKIKPPVYIGENCRINEGVRLGPNSSVGSDCLLDARCIVHDALVCPRTYVGEDLEVADAIIDRNLLANARIGSAAVITDSFLLSALNDQPLANLMRAAGSRLAAAGLLALGSPLLLATALALKLGRRGPLFRGPLVARLPHRLLGAEPAVFRMSCFVECPGVDRPLPPRRVRAAWRHLLLVFLPGLLDVVRGRLALAGQPPRTLEALAALPSDWRQGYLSAKAGLIGEALILGESAAANEEIYSAEMFYAALRGVRHDMRLLVLYAATLLGLFAPRTTPPPEEYLVSEAAPCEGVMENGRPGK